MILDIDSSLWDSNLKILTLEISGFIIENPGCSVVAPINIIIPSSINGRSESCWFFENLWISSKNRMVLLVVEVLSLNICSVRFRISDNPDDTAERD